MKDKENRVPGGSNRTKWDRNGERKSGWSIELARAKECKRC